jgi:protein-S-isoprenylcysteine O-methyltransferase Ste14
MGKIKFKKLRLWIVYPVFIIYPFVAHITDVSFWSGAVVMLLGLAVRFWASGYIRKTRELATSGPYSHTRNPLYVGNFLLGLGVCLAANNIWLVLYYSIGFLFIYDGTIKEEEKVLKDKFGASYKEYIKNVPRFFPSIKQRINVQKDTFDIHQSFKNGEFIRVFGFLLLILSLYFWHIFIFKKEGLGLNAQLAIALFLVFFALLWFNIVIRRASERR